MGEFGSDSFSLLLFFLTLVVVSGVRGSGVVVCVRACVCVISTCDARFLCFRDSDFEELRRFGCLFWGRMSLKRYDFVWMVWVIGLGKGRLFFVAFDVLEGFEGCGVGFWMSWGCIMPC